MEGFAVMRLAHCLSVSFGFSKAFEIIKTYIFLYIQVMVVFNYCFCFVIYRVIQRWRALSLFDHLIHVAKFCYLSYSVI